MTNFYRGRWGQGEILIQSFHLTCMFYLQVHTDYYIICGGRQGDTILPHLLSFHPVRPPLYPELAFSNYEHSFDNYSVIYCVCVLLSSELDAL